MVVHTDVRVWDQAVFVPIPSVNPMVVPTKAPTRDRSIVFFIPSVTPMVMPNNALVWYQDVFFYPVCESHVRAYRCTSWGIHSPLRDPDGLANRDDGGTIRSAGYWTNRYRATLFPAGVSSSLVPPPPFANICFMAPFGAKGDTRFPAR
jgi:hypothetical protein